MQCACFYILVSVVWSYRAQGPWMQFEQLCEVFRSVFFSQFRYSTSVWHTLGRFDE